MKKEEKVTELKTEYCHPSLEAIENDRKSFLGVYKKSNTLKTVVTAVCFILIIVAFIVVPQVFKNNPTLQSALTITIAVVGLGLTFLYSYFARKNIDKRMKEYFGKFYTNMNSYVLDGKGISDVKYENPGKIGLDQFVECGLYKDIFEVGSRGYTTFKYNGIDIGVCDCAGNIKGDKRIMPVFVGKYLFTSCSYESDSPVVIFLKGNEKSLPPTNIDEINIVEENEKLVIRSDSKDWKKVVTADVRKIIDSLKTDDLFVDLAICVKNKKLYVLMGYDDPLMILPLMDKFDSKPDESYKNDLEKILKLVEVLNK